MIDSTGGTLVKFNLKELIAQKSFNENRSITLGEVARETGIGVATVSRIANSRGRFHTTTLQIEKLCRYFGCTPNDLITLLPDPPADDKPAGKKKAKAKTKKTPGGEKPQGDK